MCIVTAQKPPLETFSCRFNLYSPRDSKYRDSAVLCNNKAFRE